MRKFYASLFVPQNYLAEEILLGTILMVPRIFPHIIQLIQSDFFFLESNQIIYLHIKSIYQEHKLNPTELINKLIENKALKKIGGIHKIITIMLQSQIFISSTYLNIYITEIIENIKKNYIKRLLIQYGYNIIELAYKPNICSYEIYNKASNYLNITNNKLPQQNLKNFQDIIGNILLNLTSKNQTIIKNDRINNYIPSGFIELDKLIHGLHNGDLIIIAGRPSTGKTSLIINIAIHILKTTNYGIYIFSLEMSRQQIIYKFLSIINQISFENIIKQTLNQNEIKKITKTCQYLLNSSLYINDTPNTSVDYIEYTAKLLMYHSTNLNILIIDYLQLIQIYNNRGINRVQELSYITRKLKILAQYLNIPIIVLSQLNRNIETRVNKKPLLSDLRESGCILYTSPIEINLLNNQSALNNITSTNKFLSSKHYTLDNFYNKLIFYTEYGIKYTFTIEINPFILIHLTYNHKLLNHNKWHKHSNYLEYDIISTYNIIMTHEIKYQSYIKKTQFCNYNKTYDLQIHDYQFFIKKTILFHNSIEQDADIIIMISESPDNTISKDKKIIDMILCKNRNGPIGTSNLIFNSNTTTFNNIYDYMY